MTSPRVAVLMAAHNAGSYLQQAVESILNQELQDFEFLIADDASSDGSREVLRRFARSDHRITLLHNDSNLGLTRSLERLMADVRSPYVARMDADDVSLPQRLRRQVERIERDPQLGVVGTWVRNVLGDQTPIEDVCYPDSHRWLARELLRGNCLTHGSVMFRTSCLLDLGRPIWRFRYGQDYDLYLRLLGRTGFGIVEDVLYLSRCHPASICSTISPTLRRDYMLVMRELHSLRQSGRPEFDWRAREADLLANPGTRDLQDGRTPAWYARALMEMRRGNTVTARSLLGACRSDDRLRDKARLLLAVTQLPSPLVRAFVVGMRLARLVRDPKARFVRQGGELALPGSDGHWRA